MKPPISLARPTSDLRTKDLRFPTSDVGAKDLRAKKPRPLTFELKTPDLRHPTSVLKTTELKTAETSNHRAGNRRAEDLRFPTWDFSTIQRIWSSERPRKLGFANSFEDLEPRKASEAQICLQFRGSGAPRSLGSLELPTVSRISTSDSSPGKPRELGFVDSVEDSDLRQRPREY